MAQTLAVLDMVDAIGALGASVVPHGTPVVAPYITGSGGIAWTPDQIRALARDGVHYILRIDQQSASLASAGNPYLSIKLLAVDIEPGAENNLTADHIAARRAAAGLYTVLYVNQSNYPALRQSINNLGIQAHVRYWVADWNLDRIGAIVFIEQHEGEGVIAVQYQSLANIDRSVISLGALEGVYGPFPKKKVNPIKKVVPIIKKVHPKVTAVGIAGALTTALLAYLNSKGLHVTHLTNAESGAISVASSVLAGYFAPGRKA